MKGCSSALTKVRGWPLWTKGSKNLFLEGFRNEFLAAHKQGFTAVGEFYDDVTSHWFAKYGFDLPYNQDVNDLEQDEDLYEDPLIFDDLDKDKAEEREGKVRAMCKVSIQTFLQAKKLCAEICIIRGLGNSTVTATTCKVPVPATTCPICSKSWATWAESALESQS